MTKSIAAIFFLAMLAAFNPSFAQSADASDDMDRPAVSVCPDGKYESGCTVAEMERAVSLSSDALMLISKQCLFQTEARCWVQASGTITSMERGGPVLWQHMLLSPIDGPAVQMIALAELDGKPEPKLVAVGQTEGWYTPPDIVENSDDGVLIHIPGRSGGTGAGNVDMLIKRTKNGWSHINLDMWFDDVNALLPAGFELQSAVAFNFREMHASSPVWRDGDASCCASGGMVQIDFELAADDRLAVSRIAFDETRPVGRTQYISTAEQRAENTGETQP